MDFPVFIPKVECYLLYLQSSSELVKVVFFFLTNSEGGSWAQIVEGV